MKLTLRWRYIPEYCGWDVTACLDGVRREGTRTRIPDYAKTTQWYVESAVSQMKPDWMQAGRESSERLAKGVN